MVTQIFNKNPDSISIQDLANIVLGEQKTIQLPAFQRDIVWDELHTEKLWDSIIRNFPIGSLLFAKAHSFVYKPLMGHIGKETRTNKSKQTELILIDGQQRTNAITLGFRPYKIGDTSRLWIELGEVKKTDAILYRFFRLFTS
jgi:uncharacterized protein with ParB-like and HNH nuclease domain